MSAEETWGHFFKPEVRSSGRSIFTKGNISSSQPSDTEIQAFIKGSTSFKVSFKSESIESELFAVDCNCPASKKGQFCKHIWAALLKVEKSHPDFLQSKREIEKKTVSGEKASVSKGRAQAQTEYQAASKVRQNEYRKQQYQKQKQKVKDQKQAQKKSKLQMKPDFPKDVEQALAYFSENGFPMENPLNADEVRLAKKKLSRVFHPDIGGSHDEIVTLNENFQVLMSFLDS